ncbi:hypothetical protein IV203_018453 [Nitzschia inconspicua]|uniref:Man1/Src1 C-terminal domain-containing protein n=1 Tax=Nitzschia inconspicua TaxID=303405 RepID=A0A9K3Q6J3_9STRA|nr:hypothetical protein IV203_018453 [Nitzschia inconspicua]
MPKRAAADPAPAEPQSKKEKLAAIRQKVRDGFAKEDKARLEATRARRLGEEDPNPLPSPKEDTSTATSKPKKKKEQDPPPSSTAALPAKKKISKEERAEARLRARQFIYGSQKPPKKTMPTKTAPKKAAPNVNAPIIASVEAPIIQLPQLPPQPQQLPMPAMPYGGQIGNGGMVALSPQQILALQMQQMQQYHQLAMQQGGYDSANPYSPDALAMGIGYGQHPMSATAAMSASPSAPLATVSAAPKTTSKKNAPNTNRKPRSTIKKTRQQPVDRSEESPLPPPLPVEQTETAAVHSKEQPSHVVIENVESEDDVTAGDTAGETASANVRQLDDEEEQKPRSRKSSWIVPTAVALGVVAVAVGIQTFYTYGTSKLSNDTKTENNFCFASVSGDKTVCDEMQMTAFDCPLFGTCEGGKLTECHSMYYDVSKAKDGCVLSKEGKRVVNTLESRLKAPTKSLMTCDVSDRPIFYYHDLWDKTKEGVPTFSEDFVPFLLAEGFSPQNADGAIAISLPVKSAEKLLPFSCKVADIARGAFFGTGNALVAAGVVALSSCWSMAQASPYCTLVGFVFLLGFYYHKQRKARKAAKDRELQIGHSMVLERLRNSPDSSFQAVHLRDTVVNDMYPTSQDDKIKYFKEETFPKIAALIMRDTRVLKTKGYNAKGQERDLWQWSASNGKTARFA